MASENALKLQVSARRHHKALLCFRPAFDDNIFLFTDGMANEGLTDSESIISYMHRRTQELKEEYYYPDGYSIRIATMGTGGFMPKLVYDIGQAFSSDAYQFFDESQNMELNLFRPVFLRFSTFIHRVRGKILALNGVRFDTNRTVSDFELPLNVQEFADCATEVHFYINDICEDSARHVSTSIELPPKHRKRLKEAKPSLAVAFSRVWEQEPRPNQVPIK